VIALQEKFNDYDLTYSFSDAISFDVAPRGWDKSYSVQHLLQDNFKTIHFFGAKTTKGGPDHELFIDKRVVGHTVTSPDDMMKQVAEILKE